MLARKHDDARCPRCGRTLYYGLKEESTGWKVQYTCVEPDGCGRELSPGRIPREQVTDVDEAYDRAEAMGSILY